jgi:hypothetical protein
MSVFAVVETTISRFCMGTGRVSHLLSSSSGISITAAIFMQEKALVAAWTHFLGFSLISRFPFLCHPWLPVMIAGYTIS